MKNFQNLPNNQKLKMIEDVLFFLMKEDSEIFNRSRYIYDRSWFSHILRIREYEKLVAREPLNLAYYTPKGLRCYLRALKNEKKLGRATLVEKIRKAENALLKPKMDLKEMNMRASQKYLSALEKEFNETKGQILIKELGLH